MRYLLIALALASVLVAGREGSTAARSDAQTPSTTAPPTASSSGALQRGITLMETRGDCVAAIAQFTRAAASKDLAVAARALLLKGQCEERLARVDAARVTYERLLREHPGADSVIEARKRLARLPVPSNGDAFPRLTVRRLDVPSQVPTGSASRDGRYLAYHDAGGVPWRLTLATGKAEPIVLGPGAEDGGKATSLLLSPDGQDVAYLWAERRTGVELRMMRLPAGPPVTLFTSGDLRTTRPVAWTADGRRLFALSTDAAYRVRLLSIDVSSKEVRRLAELGIFQPFRVSASRTGNLLAYDAPTAGAARDIFVLDLATGKPAVVSSHPANDALPEFLADDSGVLFVSDRLGSASLWLQPLVAGRPRGEARLVRRNVGRIWPLGTTTSGSFAYAVQSSTADVRMARVNRDGRFEELATPLTQPFAGTSDGPDWSSDGAALAFGSLRGAISTGAGSQVLVVREQTTGLERLLQPDLVMLNGHRWSPDGTRLIVRGHGTNDKYGFFMVDARTGAATPVFAVEDVERESDLGAFQWVPGREAIVYAMNGAGIRELDLRTGTWTTVVPIPAPTRITAGRGVAYDGQARRLSWTTVVGTPQAWDYALFVREADGAVRELLRTNAPDTLRLMGWMPDGQSVVVLRTFETRDGADAKTEIWRVPIDGGAPAFTGIAAPGLRAVAVHPSGEEMAYVYGSPAWQTWLMEGIR